MAWCKSGEEKADLKCTACVTLVYCQEQKKMSLFEGENVSI